jgi:CubicO group peptidase (beta-lactamase class C family)
VTDQDSAAAATPRSVLPIGSVPKQFTAAAILRLAQRGALTLDDRIENSLVRPAPHSSRPALHVASDAERGMYHRRARRWSRALRYAGRRQAMRSVYE